MVQLTLPRNSKVMPGKTWNKPQSKRGWKEFRIYRWDPDEGVNPRLDTYWVELQDLRADGSRRPDQDQERDRFDPHLPPLLPRGHLRLVLDEHRRHQHAGLPQGHRRRHAVRSPSIRCRTCSVVKDLVPDMTNFYAQLQSIEPWLKTTTPTPPKERRQDRQDREKLDGLYECILCACCSTSCPSYWWNRTAIWARPCCCRPTAGSATAATRPTGERLDNLEDPFRLYRCHTILNCTKACPKGLNPAKAIAEIKKLMVERRVESDGSHVQRGGNTMLDHVGMPVSDYARSKAFYLKVLSALGYGLVMEVSSEETGGSSHAGFGAEGKPQFWIGTGKPIKGQVHFAFVAKDRAAVRAFHAAALQGRRQGQWSARPAPALSRELLWRVCSRSRRP